jgi:hypothetical protein
VRRKVSPRASFAGASPHGTKISASHTRASPALQKIHLYMPALARITCADSLNFARIRPRGRLWQHPICKFFLHRICSASCRARREKLRATVRISVALVRVRSRANVARCADFMRLFRNVRARATREKITRSRRARALRARVDLHACARAQAPDTHIIMLSQCFFHCSGVNGVQCASIPDRTDATPAMIHG